MISRNNAYLGQLLVSREIITPAQLDSALARQQEGDKCLGAVLLEMGFVDEQKAFFPALAEQQGMDYLELKKIAIPKEAFAQIPAKFVSHHKIMPVKIQGRTIVVATADPLDMQVWDEIAVMTKMDVQFVLATEDDILDAIRRFYGVGAETVERMMGEGGLVKKTESHVNQIDESTAEASISQFLNQILSEAYRRRVSDIHIEPYEDKLKIRYRIDGVLHDAKVPEDIKHFKDAIIARTKVMANLNITEKRLPQDGKFRVRAKDVDLDLRVSYLPTPLGESLVLRILNTTQLYSLEELGLSAAEMKLLARLIRLSHGIIFLTGPTGSGKTTTLYSCLSAINKEDKKIITIEDPVEYQLEGITQIQINPLIGLTFAKGLRSMLRHDPDIMMVGEVRDIETAEIAAQVALTGHLVFSTLHTNDAAGGVARLLDMGVEPYLITSTVECFVAQRLVRLICPHCKKKVTDDLAIPAEARRFIGNASVYQGQGCESCSGTGYWGRQAIYEFLVVNEKVKKNILNRASAQAIKAESVRQGMRSLPDAGWEKVRAGLTTPQEIMRVIQEEEG